MRQNMSIKRIFKKLDYQAYTEESKTTTRRQNASSNLILSRLQATTNSVFFYSINLIYLCHKNK